MSVSSDELKILIQKILDGKGSDEEKLLIINELNSFLEELDKSVKNIIQDEDK